MARRDSREAEIRNFERVAATMPEAAAERIVRGILRNENRILIGMDAAILFADILYEAGLPSEMLSVITGDPREIADSLLTGLLPESSASGRAVILAGYEDIRAQLAANPDLRRLFGRGYFNATTQYIETGYAQHRPPG